MQLTEAIKTSGHPFEIPDCSRDDLPAFFVGLGFKVGAEIGVLRGEFSKAFCEAGLQLFAIDVWSNKNDFASAKNTLQPYPNVTLVKKDSMEAANDFPDASLDFVYIDANHEFRYIAQDLDEWTKKVRSGGVVAGHDFFYAKNRGPNRENWHVPQVLKAYVEAFAIPNWYVLGSKQANPGEKRDKWRSWMFVKP